MLFARAQYIHWFVYTAEDREFFRERTEYRDGVPSVARRLRAEVESFPDPDTALEQHPEWAAVRVKNGEWLFGRGIDSHGFGPGQGTLVVRDSRGRVRIFFGHVCGNNAGLGWSRSDLFASLDDFDKLYFPPDGMLREWVPPP